MKTARRNPSNQPGLRWNRWIRRMKEQGIIETAWPSWVMDEVNGILKGLGRRPLFNVSQTDSKFIK